MLVLSVLVGCQASNVVVPISPTASPTLPPPTPLSQTPIPIVSQTSTNQPTQAALLSTPSATPEPSQVVPSATQQATLYLVTVTPTPDANSLLTSAAQQPALVVVTVTPTPEVSPLPPVIYITATPPPLPQQPLFVPSTPQSAVVVVPLIVTATPNLFVPTPLMAITPTPFVVASATPLSVASAPQAGGGRDAEVAEFGDGLRLRVAPGLSANVLANLPAGTSLRIVGKTGDGGWFQVVAPDEKIGWVWGAYLRLFVDGASVPVTGETLQIPTVPAASGAAVVSGVASPARQIFERGQQLGNRRDVFSKVGDSITVATFVLYPFGWGSYNLGAYQHLQPVIGFFSSTNAREGNSFANISLSADNGWTTRDVLNPARARGGICQGGETPLECEYRVVKPSVALIMLGTNDLASVPIDEYRANLQRIVQISSERGVIPILSTIPNRRGFDVSAFNQTIIQIAQSNSIPLWDYWSAMQVLPNTGLSPDGVHPSYPSETDFAAAANFNGDNLSYGYVIRNLTALEVLDSVWRQVLSY